MAGSDLRDRFLSAAPALGLLVWGLAIGPKFDRYVLPAFDGYVYDAMADTPEVFTLAPWGYRILAPRIVHILPFASAAEGFFWLNLGCLAAALFALGVWLRRLGFGAWPSALAGAALLASRPMRELMHYQVLVDPLALLIITLTLLELTNPRLLVLSALFAAGALTKEVCLLPLVILPFVLAPKEGWKKAVIRTFAVAAPAACLAVYLRATWGEPRAALDASIVDLVMERLRRSADVLPGTLLLSGVGLLALAGFVRETSRPLRIQAAAMWALTFAAVFLNPYHFSTPDLPRLSVVVWPALLPLALAGLGFRRAESPAPAPRPGRLAPIAAVITLLVCASLVAATDPFRHEPEDAWADPIPYLARNREAIKTARFLEDGGVFVFDSRSGRFAEPITERFNLTEGRRQRWFLFKGFGPQAVFESGAPEFRGEADLLLPVMSPRTVSLSIQFEGTEGTEVRIGVGGRPVASIPVGGEGGTFQVPGNMLKRGDNLLRLSSPGGAPVRLIRFDARQ
ncbi:MAG: hypothetical protein K1Y01_04055 [Vicinamibacteria bacterium]|nr:hypothetical protein [Vicinamibacteria bacterium]